ncbi:MAG: hypothetical protein KKC39_08345 [Candidatus Omnitrophica bacterium]|nr:hypothetical protein [Candidatus Omnitrophota bacterium]MBU4302852.1 hypothetical protein [Candidatus Omnitrophota bacterium]MBU4468727.1 hypothetical protein [Candidatus Omnitrophota bacterium]MCG2707745.1 hypothetical protein [Candidatus Omnitrophota bacterium]MDP2831616.1 hypothetical protein [Candidatus Omnitrophota bacterium]
MAAEEKKCCGTEKKCCDPKKALATLFKVVLGLAFLVLGGWAILEFWGALLVMIKGCIGLFLILAGVITLAIAKE